MENYNKNNAGWQQRLAEMDSLPGEQIDLTVSWEKLHARRKEVPVQRKIGWYWIAAAFFIVLFPFAWLFGGRKTISNSLDLAKNITVPAFQRAATPQKNDAIISVTSDYLKGAGVKKLLTPEIKTNHVKFKIADSIVKDNLPTNGYAQTLLTADTVTAPVAVPAIKRKMAVVHLNEVNDQGHNIITEQPGRPFFPVKFRSRETLSSNSTNNGNSRDNIIRIKLSSQN